MNIYDFDKTIYNGDSTTDFYFYCLKKYPKILLTVPMTSFAFAMYIIGAWSKTKFKEIMYRFLLYVENPEHEAELFWAEHGGNIKEYYRKTRRPDDIVISASPEFLLKPIAERLGFGRLIASRVDPRTGKYDGENCHGEEKVRRLHAELPEVRCEEFYSDSFSDAPLARLAERAYIVKGQELIDWEKAENSGKNKIKEMFFSKEFIMFLVVGGINTINGVLFSMLYGYLIPDENLAFAAGYVTSTIISYLLNSFLTFHERLSLVRYVKFFVSYIPNFIIQLAVVFIVCTVLGVYKLIAYILAAVIGVPVTFLLMKVFAFAKH
ncbi:MAG TPA: HAD-IB family phosphatase [Candidatus Ornithomonoglobus intestinigallinarum]|uniref:HAD-IB family phosphatase n=1 Tax=Candidatus Ornithomonoglobus intestinigallinarum TaxID=2840894 RepID=A0A9D1H587_9FIRM|nr:HAD-IB family phosphatase [Candidatus Ornithomonoglobus intestinigallinarum]